MKLMKYICVLSLPLLSLPLHADPVPNYFSALGRVAFVNLTRTVSTGTVTDASLVLLSRDSEGLEYIPIECATPGDCDTPSDFLSCLPLNKISTPIDNDTSYEHYECETLYEPYGACVGTIGRIKIQPGPTITLVGEVATFKPFVCPTE